MKIAQHIPSPFARPLGGGQPQPPGEPPEKLDKAVLAGRIVGGLGVGLGLGYVGMDLGLRLGMDCGMKAFGPHPAAQILALLTVGVARGVVGAGIGGALGMTAGGGIGCWLGGKVGQQLS